MTTHEEGGGAPGGSVSGVECARLTAEDLNKESLTWLRRLSAEGGERQAAERELHARLVRVALAEVRRRGAGTPVNGRELEDWHAGSRKPAP